MADGLIIPSLPKLLSIFPSVSRILIHTVNRHVQKITILMPLFVT